MNTNSSNTKERKSISDRLYGNYMGRRNAARTNRALDATWRGIILVVGLTMVGLGLFFLLFPGPGWAVIIIGQTPDWKEPPCAPLPTPLRTCSLTPAEYKHSAKAAYWLRNSEIDTSELRNAPLL